MAESQHVLGIDYGTGGCRVGIFDRNGAPVAFEAREFPTSFPRSGWAEQDPDAVVGGPDRRDQACAREERRGRRDIAGIGAGTTAATVVAMDENGTPAAGHPVDGRARLRPGEAHL